MRSYLFSFLFPLSIHPPLFLVVHDFFFSVDAGERWPLLRSWKASLRPRCHSGDWMRSASLGFCSMQPSIHHQNFSWPRIQDSLKNYSRARKLTISYVFRCDNPGVSFTAFENVEKYLCSESFTSPPERRALHHSWIENIRIFEVK